MNEEARRDCDSGSEAVEPPAAGGAGSACHAGLLWRLADLILGSREGRRATLVAAVVIGLCAALAAATLKIFTRSVEHALTIATSSERLRALYFILPPLGIAVTAFLVRFAVKRDLSHGVAKVLEAKAVGGGRLDGRAIWAPLLACSITVGSGGSVGMEAPILHSGAAIGSKVAELFGMDRRRRVLLLGCGAAAAIAAIFKAPIAGVVFVLEVLMLESTVPSKVPLLVAAVTAALFSRILTRTELEFGFAAFEPFDYRNAPWYLLLGLLSGLLAAYFQRVNRFVEERLARLSSLPVRLLAGGGAVGLLVLLMPPLFGEGYSALEAVLSGSSAALVSRTGWYPQGADAWGMAAFALLAVLLKPAAVAATNGSGGVGGVFAPSLFSGGLTGFALGRALRLLGVGTVIETNFALVGMGGFMAALMHSPLTGIFLIAELTGGYRLLLPLIICATSAYATHRSLLKRSIYAERLAEAGVPGVCWDEGD